MLSDKLLDRIAKQHDGTHSCEGPICLGMAIRRTLVAERENRKLRAALRHAIREVDGVAAVISYSNRHSASNLIAETSRMARALGGRGKKERKR